VDGRDGERQVEKPYSPKPDGPQGVESDWSETLSLDILDEAAEKSGTVFCEALVESKA